MIHNKKRINTCPTDITEYNKHSLVGRIIEKEVFGYDLTIMTFPNDYELFVTDSNNATIGGTYTFNNVTDLVTEINNILGSFGNGTIFTSVIDNGRLIVYATNTIINNVEIGLRDNTTGQWVTGNVPDPDGNGNTGLPPYSILIGDLNNGNTCELIKITPDTFNCDTDEILFIKYSGASIPSNYVPYDFGNTVFGAFGVTDALSLYIFTFYAYKAGTSYDSVNIPALTIPFNSGTDQGVIATNIAQIQAAINLVLPSIGYAANEAIFSILNNNELAIWYSPAFAANVTSGDYLHMYAGPVDTASNYNNNVDFTTLTSYQLSDVKFPALVSGMKTGKLPCLPSPIIPKPIISLQQFQEPQHAVLPPPIIAFDNNIKITIRYPEGFSDFETMVATGNVRLQLQHADGRCRIKHKDINGNIIFTQKERIKWNYAKHRNGTLDVGDYIFGGDTRDNGANLYPDKDTMMYLPATLKPRQTVSFELDPALWYGYGSAANCGMISSMLPMKWGDFLGTPYCVLCGEGNKKYFINSTMEQNDRKYFRFLLMYKLNNRWIESVAASDPFYIECKLGTTLTGNEIERWVIGFASRMA